MHELICDGHDLKIVDSKTGADITNMVLTQILLERDAPKLDIFPSAILHQIIRTQQQFLGSVMEQFFAQVLEGHKASHHQWARFLRNTLGVEGLPTDPMDWTRSVFEAFTPGGRTRDEKGHESEPKRDREDESLRSQIEELTRQVRRMADARPNSQE